MIEKGKKTRLLEIVKSFTTADYKEFGKFLHSPYFNENHLYIELFNIFESTSKAGRLENLTPEKIHSRLFPEKEFNWTYLRRVFSDFNRLVERYFSVINFEKYFYRTEFHLLKEINLRSIGDLYPVRLKSYQKKINKFSKYEPNQLSTDMLLMYESYRYYSSDNDIKKMKEAILAIDETNNNLALSIKLITYLMKKILSLLSNEKFNGRIEADEIKIIEKNKEYYIKEAPGIYLTYLVSIMLRDDGVNKYIEIGNFAVKNRNKISYAILDFAYNIMLAFIVYKIKIGTIISGKISLAVSYHIEELGVLKRSKTISPINFLSVSLLSLETNNLEFAKVYMDSHIRNLNPQMRQDIYNLAAAEIHFAAGEYNDAIEHLGKVKTGYLYAYLSKNQLLIKIFERKSEHHKAKNILNKMHLYAKRNKDIPKEIREKILQNLI